MEFLKDNKTYNAAIYVRLSRDDGDKEESYSISNQKELIRENLKLKSNINITSIHIDDGYSGVDFNRPAFMAMMDEEIEKRDKLCCCKRPFAFWKKLY